MRSIAHSTSILIPLSRKHPMKTAINTDMDLKSRIIAILESRNLSYETLVNYLGISQADLDKAFDENTLEIRTLELISKELRIPLYSFFREAGTEFNFSEKGEIFYNTHIWAPGEIQIRAEIDAIKKELERVKFELAKKELIIQSLEEELKGKMK
jgi:transcriptional regulator with XRE-family HTH domain